MYMTGSRCFDRYYSSVRVLRGIMFADEILWLNLLIVGCKVRPSSECVFQHMRKYRFSPGGLTDVCRRDR